MFNHESQGAAVMQFTGKPAALTIARSRVRVAALATTTLAPIMQRPTTGI
jgi:hypothetical protein